MPVRTFSSFEAFIEANEHAKLRPMVLGMIADSRCSPIYWLTT